MHEQWKEGRQFHALALTGGGYRGLFTARALQVIEEHIQQPIGSRFDLICGASIGGVIALAIAFEVPMSRVVKLFEEEGENIFPPHKVSRNAIGRIAGLIRYSKKPKYSASVLRDALSKLIAADRVLGDAKHPVAIPAVNVTQGRPQVFKTRHKAEWVRDWKLKVGDIAIATAAAPTYFELAEVEGHLYADGGLFANAPDLIAIHEAEHFLRVPVQDIWLLSIGATTKSYSLSFRAGRQFGIADWMTEDRLFAVTISSQQQFVDQLVSHRLGERYLRLDHEPSQEQARDLGLDVATLDARRTLTALAEKATTDILGNRMRRFLDHTPSLQVMEVC
jgi:patatin-like phospholipase/acyl hydrolase